MSDALILAVGGVIALVIALVDEARTQGQSLASWGVAVIGAALVIVYFANS